MDPQNFLGKVEVEKSIQPLPRSDRKAPVLKPYKWYFISFHGHHAYPCRLIQIFSKPGLSKRIVAIEIPMKYESSRSYININGNRSNTKVSSHEVEEDEIGNTPEDAVRNQV